MCARNEKWMRISFVLVLKAIGLTVLLVTVTNIFLCEWEFSESSSKPAIHIPSRVGASQHTTNIRQPKYNSVRIPPHIASLFPTADSPTDLSLLPLYHNTHTRTVEPQGSAGKYCDIFQVLERWDNFSLHFLPSPVSDTQYRGQSEWKRVSPYER